ncbi:MAG: polysaccharide biosynthesis protein [Sphingopyxis macrogoltabida]|uniref:Polysaccharide biosynthesis protein n=1 Tax=Sphingopyxis macrogoltabida TaxID=33050 RepID=A0A2W5MVF6_SPHMC|nr:MAG: polysaccharide biosynthesis protein [Sphingopyxis macrogoltabida]
MTPDSNESHRQIWSFLSKLLKGKLVAGILSLGYFAIAARMLGVHDYGVLLLVHGYAIFVGGVLALSGWHGLVRFGHDALAARDHGGFRKLATFMAGLELGVFLLALCAAALLAPMVGPRLGWPPEATRFAPLYAVAIFATVRMTPNAILQIAGRFDLVGWHQIVMPASRLAGAVILWFAGAGLREFLWVWLISALLEGVSMWLMAAWAWRQMQIERTAVPGTAMPNRVNRGFLGFVLTTNADITLREFGPRVIPLIVGATLGPAAAGLFSVAQRAGLIFEQPAQLLGHASYAVAAKLAAEGRVAESRSAIWKSIGIAMLLAIPLTVVVALLAKPILTLLGGPGFSSASTLLILIVIAKMLQIGAPTLAAALAAMKRPGHSILINLGANIAMLWALPLLLGAFGLEGAGLHMIAQSAVMMAAFALITNKAYRRAARKPGFAG